MSEKYKKTNAYIQKVEDHKNIINIEKEAFENKWKWKSFFKNQNDIVIEVWTWLWNFFSTEVSKNPNENYIWFEIRFKRLFVTAEKTLEKWWENFTLIKTPAQNIDKIFDENEVSKTYVFFPDPWDKKDRQRKHRLWSEKFIEDLYKITKQWWKVIFKTDHLWYFEDTLELLKSFWKWKITKLSYDYENELSDFDKKNMTEFEEIFRKDKIKINYIELEKAGQ